MGILRITGIFLEVGNLPSWHGDWLDQQWEYSSEVLLAIPTYFGEISSLHILEKFWGYREISLLCFDSSKEGDSMLFPILGTSATLRARKFPLKSNLCLFCFIVNPLTPSLFKFSMRSLPLLR